MPAQVESQAEVDKTATMVHRTIFNRGREPSYIKRILEEQKRKERDELFLHRYGVPFSRVDD